MDPVLEQTLYEIHLQEQFGIIKSKVVSFIQNMLKKKGVNYVQITKKIQPQVKALKSELEKTNGALTGSGLKMFEKIVKFVDNMIPSEESSKVTHALASSVVFLALVMSGVYFINILIPLLLISSPLLIGSMIIDFIIRSMRKMPPGEKAKVMQTKSAMEQVFKSNLG